MGRKFHRRVEVGGLREWTEEAVYVRDLRARERLSLAERFGEAKAGGAAVGAEVMAAVCAAAAEDADGKPLFADEADAAEAPGRMLEAIYAKAAKLNRLTEDAQEELRKNSKRADYDGSPNGSACVPAGST